MESCQCTKTQTIRKLELKVNQQARTIRSLRNKLSVAKAASKTHSANVRDRLRGRFGSGAISYFTTGRRPGQWPTDDLYYAVSIRAMSQKTYSFLRTSLKLPLPSPSTLNRFMNRFRCEPGTMSNVLRLLQHFTSDFGPLEKLTVMNFDEMSVKSLVEYDRSTDSVYGPHSDVQVIMIRGLVKQFKQPVYFDFDETMSSEIFNSVVASVEACGLNICACVCDMGGKNRKFWKELGINEDANFISNPTCYDRKIFFFADIPHVIKLYRNHVLDSGIEYCGSKIDKSLIEQILLKDQSELKICHKLSVRHLDVRNSGRQNVRMAAQLLSGTTAAAIEYFFPERKGAAQHISAINSTFDVLNSRVPHLPSNPIGGGFGTQRDKQIEVLDKMENILLNSRVVGKKELLPFQRGFLLSIRSLRQLHDYLFCRYELQYILTARLNQDLLENLFSQIRGTGVFYHHPTPVTVKHRMRSLLVGAKGSVFTAASVAADDVSEQEHYVSSELFRRGVNNTEQVCLTEERDDDSSFSEVHVDEDLSLSLDDINVRGYIGGYVAHKLRVTYPSLGVLTDKVSTLDERCTWTSKFQEVACWILPETG